MMAESRNGQHERLLPRPIWWLLFGVATYVMSLWFQAFRVFTVQPGMQSALTLLGVMALLAVVLFVMIYDSYVYEKSRGRIEKPVRFLERLHEKRFLMRAARPKQGDEQ